MHKTKFLAAFIMWFSIHHLYSQDSMTIINKLAVYKFGTGEPVLLMPYPHASAYYSMSESPLVRIFNESGYSVLTFDPPGIFKSTREATVDLNEMLSCTDEVLDYFKIEDSILVVGHSQSGFCSLAYAIENPGKVKKLILIGSVSGWPMVRKSSIHKQFGWFTKERWQIMYWGTRKMLGISNLYIHKRLDRMVKKKSFVDKSYADNISINKADKKDPEPVRAAWMVNLRKYNYDYSRRLCEITVPTLICVGKYDPQTPVRANLELKDGITNSVIEIFEKSGHSPFVEEREKFVNVIREWLKQKTPV